ncbi:hypothetical protein [Oceanobacillus sojae]|uniref:hypothetical protein n=1 Tax=Oceanobacillus sojae TaxID=582851 RepID=UPI0021A6C182|nr:hypothetical protein [Oceanobacillus sojae]MCT1902926.1 hypothetical protein [Oceanobacillus sojae]
MNGGERKSQKQEKAERIKEITQQEIFCSIFSSGFPKLLYFQYVFFFGPSEVCFDG